MLAVGVAGPGRSSRVHDYRYGDGGADLRVRFVPHPLGTLEA
jgi:hypothetical protein